MTALARKPPPKRATLVQCQYLERVLRTAGALGRLRSITKRDLLPLVPELGAAQPSRERVVRSIIAAAPGLGVPLGSWNAGYFILEEPTDYAVCRNDLLSRMSELRLRIEQLDELEAAGWSPVDGRLF